MQDDFNARFSERVSGLPYSAPLYAEMIRAATIPKISGCMEIKSETLNRCTCNSQQGTIITTISYQACVSYLHNGWFDFSKPDDNGSTGTAQQATNTAISNPLGLGQTATPAPQAAGAGAGALAVF